MIIVLLMLAYLLPLAIAAFSVEFRQATPNDVSVARKILLQEKMNPLSISEETLLVASDGDEDALLGFGQIRPLDEDYSELASLYVYPEFRHQGIGTELVSRLLERHDDATTVCLLTLKPTTPFYEKHGFTQVKDKKNLPPPLKFEFTAGTLLSAVLGNDLVCMVRTTTSFP